MYKFTCASCSSSYIGETCRHFKTRIEEHIEKDNKSHIFKHLHSTETCFDLYNSLCFKVIDQLILKFDLKIREAVHINWRKPNLMHTLHYSFYCLNYTLRLLHLFVTHLVTDFRITIQLTYVLGNYYDLCKYH